MFKFLKDGKRRAVETVLSAVGKSETTVDADYNLSCERCVGNNLLSFSPSSSSSPSFSLIFF